MKTKIVFILAFAFATISLVSCTSFWQMGTGTMREGVSSSLVNYLYPGGEKPPPYEDVVPVLNLPLRVGIAFVPPTGYTDIPGLSEAVKIELLDKVRGEFLERDYISSIQVIPETYMRGTAGFSDLEQIARLYSLEIIALVSYDQVVAVDDTTSSILYWTIVGAYFIEGSRNDVQTFVDTAVFHIASRKLMIRAPGVDKSAQKSTLVESSRELREARTESFKNAMSDMTTNLQMELDRFELRLKEDSTVAKVNKNAMPGGGGTIGLCVLLALCLVTLLRTEYWCRLFSGRTP
jgi:rhombotail lipoprotein